MKLYDNEDVYGVLTDKIIFRMNLIGARCYDVIYEYIKSNVKKLTNFNSVAIISKWCNSHGVTDEYDRLFCLTQNEEETNCILTSFKKTLRYLPIQSTSISKLVSDGIEESDGIMTFQMTIPENNDIKKTWTFTKQFVNAVGALEEKYMPHKRRIEVVFCPIDIYEETVALKETLIAKKAWDDRHEFTTSDPEFVSFPIKNSYLIDKCDRITVTPLDEDNKYLIVLNSPNKWGKSETIQASSLYEAYLMYMSKYGYFDAYAQDDKHPRLS